MSRFFAAVDDDDDEYLPSEEDEEDDLGDVYRAATADDDEDEEEEDGEEVRIDLDDLLELASDEQAAQQNAANSGNQSLPLPSTGSLQRRFRFVRAAVSALWSRQHLISADTLRIE